MQSLNELHAGRFLGRYELLLPIAQGGMAAVWAARLKGTRGFQRVVAIKTILPSLSDDARFEQMFLDEAALASRIRHSNVVQVLDLGEEGGLLFQVMEWIDGEPLSAFLRELPEGRGLPYAIAARALIGACEGLHAAHETRDDADKSVGLVHRDVSPQNILVTRDGVPKVVDFGVAKASTLSSAHTATGTLKGKPAYMAPEQIHGDSIDRRADVFSLGVMAYVLTTGHHPFRGKNDMATLHSICSSEQAEPPSKYAKDYPEALEEVVLMASNKDREKRFASAAALARAMEAAVPGVHKVGDAELAAFTRTLLAGKLEAKANGLRKALAEADERAAEPSTRRSHRPVRSPSTLQGIGGPTPVQRDASSSDTTNPLLPSTPPAVSSPPVPSPDAATPATHATTASIAPPKRSNGLVIALATLAALLVLGIAGAAGFFFVVRPRLQAAAATPGTETVSPPVVDPPPVDPTPTAVDTATPDTPSEAISAEAISAEALPTATQLPPSVGHTGKPPTTSATPTTVPSNTAEPPATATSSKPPATSPPTGTGVRGTVPKIRDPGF